jgi:transaldolase/transaldolase/glucose-6-phosphate isomerase
MLSSRQASMLVLLNQTHFSNKTNKTHCAMVQNKIKQIRNFGQSIWLDYFDREIMNSDKLKKMIVEDGISGVTTNPAIFERAISAGSDYDDDIINLSQTKSSTEAVFFGLAVKDIKRAANFFKPAYEKSNGEDGFVSLEVSPRLAYNTEETIKQARELWKAVDHRNVMIKIPSTAEGLAAIRKCISEGININITLLFGLPRYEQVIDAYLSGLEDRVKANEPIDQIASVASFFLSRIDVIIDPILRANKLGRLEGMVAITMAKKAYEIYQKAFSSERFKHLEAKGAKRQHVLWASTSTKDPAFSDIKYVAALIGPETINTVTLETLDAFRDHGRVESRLEDNLSIASEIIKQLKDHKIDIDVITKTLEVEGIEKFNKAYNKVLTAIEMKKNKQTA